MSESPTHDTASVAATDVGVGVRPEAVGAPGESVFVDLDEVRLHTVQAGPEDGDLVVLLHGFPEFWYGWHDQIRPLANAGYRVVVPDQRGYHLSDKPDDVTAYGMDALAGDVVGHLDALGRERATVVGHDWGAAVAWWVGLHHSDRVARLVPMNVPHPTVFRRTLDHSWNQRLRSWYVLLFQVPTLPELTARLGDWRLPVRMMRQTSQPGTFSQTDFERYRTAWSMPGASSAMVNWYRAVVRERPRPRTERVEPPTVVVWGVRDQFLKKSMARASVDCCADGRLKLFPQATHWVNHEEPVAISNLLLDFLAE